MTVVGHQRKLSGLSSALLNSVVPLDNDSVFKSNNHKGGVTTVLSISSSSKPELIRAQPTLRTQREHGVKRSISSSCRIRSRLLNSLGIDSAKEQAAAAASLHSRGSDDENESGRRAAVAPNGTRGASRASLERRSLRSSSRSPRSIFVWRWKKACSDSLTSRIRWC